MGTAFSVFSALRLRLDAKTIRDQGQDSVTDATNGKVVSFNKSFVDIKSITVTAAYNASYPVLAVYDFVDTPNPTEFTAYLYRVDTGAKVTGDFRWEVSGI